MEIKRDYLNHNINNSIGVKGFTLIELVMVIVLLAVVSIIVTPRFFNRDTVDHRFLTNHVLNSIKYARKIAMASGCLTRFFTTNNSYYILQDANCFDSNEATDLSQNVWDPEKLAMGYSYTYDANQYQITSGTFPIIFNARGEVVNIATQTDQTATVRVVSSKTSQINIRRYSIEVAL